MLQAQQSSLHQSLEQTQMPALASAQPDTSAVKASTSHTEAQLHNERDISGSETAPSVVPPCPTNWHQVPLEQSHPEELHNSPDIYRSPAPFIKCDDQHRQQEEGSSKPREDEERITTAENGLIHHAANQLGLHGDLPNPPQNNSYVAQTLQTYPSQVKCSVNQESYEHQIGQVRRSTVSQSSKVMGSSMGQNKMDGVVLPSDATGHSSSNSKAFPAQGSQSLQSKVPSSYTSIQIKNGVDTSLPPTTSYQATGPTSQSNLEAHRHGTHVLTQVTMSTQVAVTSPMSTGTMHHHDAASLQIRSTSTSSAFGTSNLSRQVQAQVPKNVPEVPRATAHKNFGESNLSSQPPSKKQKLNGDPLDQSIDQINDVTVVSGVNLKEEEEKLLAEPAEKSHTSEALKRFVQEEEHKLFLEEKPLRQKIMEIANKYGIQSVSEDVVRCLSLSIEEWYRNLLGKLIRFSKQRCDLAKEKQKILLTSDVRRQIMIAKKKIKEAKQAKGAKEALGRNQADNSLQQSEENVKVHEDKAESRPKGQKVRKDDEKVRVNATNIAARRAVGGDDMFLKWQLMAEQARLKRSREPGGSDGVAADQVASSSGVTSDKEVTKTVHYENAAPGLVTTQRKMETGVPTVTADSGRPPGMMPKSLRKQSRMAYLITVKDMISVLEMEPRMAKSTLLYRLCNRNLATTS